MGNESPRDQRQFCLLPSVGQLLPAWFAIAAIIAAATAATAPIAVASAVSARASSTAAAILARLGFVDFQCAATDFFAIELIDGCGGFFLGGHFDEGEPS